VTPLLVVPVVSKVNVKLENGELLADVAVSPDAADKLYNASFERVRGSADL
jgi:hypothetical protein